MANHEAIQVSSFPLPPKQYISLYTDENVRAARTPKPPLPPSDAYTMFGNPFTNDDNIIRPLESQGFKRLYPQHFDRRKELKKFNHSLLVNFLDLMDLLVSCPDSPRRAEKIEDLSLLFVNMHHLVNEFRPHQARETLRVMMEMQKRQRLETIQRFQKHLDKVNSIVKIAFSSLPEKDENNEMFLPKISQEKKTKGNNLEQLDHIMCDIVDNQGI